MPFHLNRYAIRSKEEKELYTYIVADYPHEPSLCAKTGCDSIYFSPCDQTHPQSHRICDVLERKPTIIYASRIRYKCKKCGITFAADAEETADWYSDFSPTFRNHVITYWLKSDIKSVYDCSNLFGIGRDNLTEWEQVLADAFYKNQVIEGFELIYFGSFQCYKDNTPHAFIAETEEAYGGLIGFIREYTTKGIVTAEKERLADTDRVKRVRYDYVPGIGKELHKLFPNAEFAVNRRNLRETIECLLPGYDRVSELSTLLQPTGPTNDDSFSGALIEWANRIPDEQPNKDQVMNIIMEITEDMDLYNSLSFPSAHRITDSIRKMIDKRVGKKASFDSIMLQMMYNNERWKTMVRNAGSSVGYEIGFVASGNRRYTEQKNHKYDGNERIEWFEILEKQLDEYDQEDDLD